MKTNILIRNYDPKDYEGVVRLYKDPSTFGGQYDDARDSSQKLADLSKDKPDCILVAEVNKNIVGTVTLFEDRRSAWLYRFAIQKDREQEIAQVLFTEAKRILKLKGHTQVLVYAPKENKAFEQRYQNIGFSKGSDFTAYWQDI